MSALTDVCAALLTVGRDTGTIANDLQERSQQLRLAAARAAAVRSDDQTVVQAARRAAQAFQIAANACAQAAKLVQEVDRRAQRYVAQNCGSNSPAHSVRQTDAPGITAPPPRLGAGGSWPVQEEQPGGAVGQTNALSCVAAVGEMLSDGRLSQEQLIRDIGAPASVGSLARALGRSWRGGGLAGRSDFERVLSTAPFGAALHDGGRIAHLVVVAGADESGNLRIRDSWGGGSTYTMHREDFWKYWNGQVIFDSSR